MNDRAVLITLRQSDATSNLGTRMSSAPDSASQYANASKTSGFVIPSYTVADAPSARYLVMNMWVGDCCYPSWISFRRTHQIAHKVARISMNFQKRIGNWIPRWRGLVLSNSHSLTGRVRSVNKIQKVTLSILLASAHNYIHIIMQKIQTMA